MTLSEVEAGRKVRLMSVDAGHGLKSRLVSMGLTPGAELTVVRNARTGPVIVQVRETRLMLGRAMVDKIEVG